MTIHVCQTKYLLHIHNSRISSVSVPTYNIVGTVYISLPKLSKLIIILNILLKFERIILMILCYIISINIWLQISFLQAVKKYIFVLNVLGYKKLYFIMKKYILYTTGKD